MKKIVLLLTVTGLFLFSGCIDIGFGFAEDDPDLHSEMLEKPENQYELTDSVAYSPKGFYRRVPANGETYDWYRLGSGTTGGLSSLDNGRHYSKTVSDGREKAGAEFVSVDTLLAIADTQYNITPPILMDDGSVCYSLSYEDNRFGYEDSTWIYNSQLGLLYTSESYSDGMMDGHYSRSVLLSCSFTNTSVGKLLNEYYAKRGLPLKEL